MAVTNQITKNVPYAASNIAAVVRDARFGQQLEADFVSEEPTANGYRFFYARKSTLHRYGRNYKVTLADVGNGTCNITVLTQSRKVTVLFDPKWRDEVGKVFTIIESLL